MKKLLILTLGISILGLSSVASASFAALAECGSDHARAVKEQLPPNYCFAKQERGDDNFGGKLFPACEGTACPIPNNVYFKK